MFSRDPHREVNELLSDYVDNRLAAEQRARVEQHLAGCALCQEDLLTLRAVARALRALPAAAPPRSLRLTPAMAGLTRPARAPEPARPRSRPWLQPLFAWGGALAALAFLLVVGVDLISSSRTNSPANRTSSTAAQSAPNADSAPASGESSLPLTAPSQATVPAKSATSGAGGANSGGAAPAATPTAGGGAAIAPATGRTPTQTAPPVTASGAGPDSATPTARGGQTPLPAPTAGRSSSQPAATAASGTTGAAPPVVPGNATPPTTGSQASPSPGAMPSPGVAQGVAPAGSESGSQPVISPGTAAPAPAEDTTRLAWRVAEVLLLVLAIGLLGVAWYQVWRRARGTGR